MAVHVRYDLAVANAAQLGRGCEPPLRWHNQPPTILRHIELGGCIETPRLAICLAQPVV
jgi:hypothetical protein